MRKNNSRKDRRNHNTVAKNQMIINRTDRQQDAAQNLRMTGYDGVRGTGVYGDGQIFI